MKKSFIYFAMLCITSIFISCKDEEDPTLEVNPATVTIPVAGTAQTVTVTSNADWVVNKPGSAAWLTVTSGSGNGNGSFSLSATDNSDSKDPRNTTLTVVAGGLTKSITVTQSGVDAPAAAGEITITGTFCDNQSAVLSISAINRASSYKWYKNGAAIEGATELSYTATAHGSYTVAGVNAAGEGAQSPAKVIEQCPLTIDDLVGEWTVTEKQGMAPTGSPTEVSYTIAIALKAGTTDSITVSGIGNGAGVLGASISTSTIKAGIRSSGNDLLMSIPAQKVSPKWPDHMAGTAFFAISRNDAQMNLSIVSQNFPDVTITRAADGSISCTLVGSAAPHSYAFANEMMAGVAYIMSMAARDTRWVKNAE